MFSSFLTALLIAGLAAALGYSIHYIPGIKEDNPIEEKCEEVIKKETGIAIDLTPKTPEKEKDE
jgi:hypothetical protein